MGGRVCARPSCRHRRLVGGGASPGVNTPHRHRFPYARRRLPRLHHHRGPPGGSADRSLDRASVVGRLGHAGAVSRAPDRHLRPAGTPDSGRCARRRGLVHRRLRRADDLSLASRGARRRARAGDVGACAPLDAAADPGRVRLPDPRQPGIPDARRVPRRALRHRARQARSCLGHRGTPGVPVCDVREGHACAHRAATVRALAADDVRA